MNIIKKTIFLLLVLNLYTQVLKKILAATKELRVIQGDTTVTFYPSRDE